MPSLTFILPHSLYWAGLLLFPFLAMYLVRRKRDSGPKAPYPFRWLTCS